MAQRKIMIGLADLEMTYCIPYYQAFTLDEKEGADSIRRLVLAMAKLRKAKKFVFMSFPATTPWTEADKKLDVLWKKHAS